jgi:hypothetical protein
MYHYQFKKNIINALNGHDVDYIISAVNDERFNQDVKLNDDKFFIELLFLSGIPASNVKKIINSKPNLLHRDTIKEGLKVVFSRHRKDLCELLKDFDVNLNVQHPTFGNALHIASRKDGAAFMNYLVSNEVNILELNSRAEKPSDVAKRWGSYKNVEILSKLEESPKLIDSIINKYYTDKTISVCEVYP